MSTLIQRSFSSGEIDPALHGRVDLARYATGLKTGRNGFIPKTGGFSNRSGTEFLKELTGTDFKLVDWINQDVSHCLVFSTDGSLKIFKNGRNCLEFDDDGNTIIYPSWNIVAVYSVGQIIVYSGVYYHCLQPNVGFQPDISPTQWYPMPAGQFQIAHPYSTDVVNISYVQEEFYMMIACETYRPRNLVRASDTQWYFENWKSKLESGVAFYGVPSLDPPAGLAQSGGAGSAAAWAVTTLDANFEESFPSTQVFGGTVPSTGTPVTLTWTAVTGAFGYNIYRNYAGLLLLTGFSRTNTYVDQISQSSLTADTAPIGQAIFAESNAYYPKVIGRFQARTLLGSFNNLSERVEASIVGFRENFSSKYPLADDAALTFNVKGRRENAIKHFVDLGALMIFTADGEWIVKGDQQGILKPSSAIPEQYSYNGANDLSPIVIGSDAMYVQKQGNIIRTLGFDIGTGGRDGYKDSDLTFFARHLFKNKTIDTWAFQKVPHYVVWMALNDGSFVAFTFNKEQQIIAFTRGDTDGEVKELLSIPEGNAFALYAVVKRVINGSDKYYLERFYDRDFSDIIDAVFLDCAKSYDGRETAGNDVTVTGGTAWDDSEILTLTSANPIFSADDVGSQIWIRDNSGDIIRLTITAYIGAFTVSVNPHKVIPAPQRSTAITNYSYARKTVTGLSHLEGKAVSVYADGFVVASPNNDAYGVLTVTGGEIELPQAYERIHVGLPYITDLETLDLDTAQGETVVDKQMLVQKVTMHLDETRGLFVGGRAPVTSTLDGLTELKIRDQENYEDPVAPLTGKTDVVIESHWNSNGRVFVRQVDPLPVTIHSVAPSGYFPFR